jgi:hypothetical protein
MRIVAAALTGATLNIQIKWNLHENAPWSQEGGMDRTSRRGAESLAV